MFGKKNWRVFKIEAVTMFEGVGPARKVVPLRPGGCVSNRSRFHVELRGQSGGVGGEYTNVRRKAGQ